ncbi:hypothetical protein Q9295_03430 [Xinfangfangia sp. CPCC 101601]|uniref:Uncharacterized protein n=1 Tax=Pseudogemmobacter lacusdianii TaxID=3069608 RepID=A0ABU0VUK2_9RHOB|nr:hypothetical protein [Xinfangfangia sp. CPCC 101601]MDQ2065412.1 hypothetical protein [Xinfangfangia sp. CPCC 101601]
MATYRSFKPSPQFYINGLHGYGLMGCDRRHDIDATGDCAIGWRDSRQRDHTIQIMLESAF